MNKRPKVRLIQSLDRGLSILDTLASQDEPVAITELARRMALDSSTVYRLLSTLRAHGYAKQGSGDKRYDLGPKALELGQKALRKYGLRELGASFMRELSTSAGVTAQLTSFVGGKATIVDKWEGPGVLTVAPRIGSEAWLWCTASGKTIAACLSEEDLGEVLGRTGMRRFTDKTITDLGVLRDHLRKVREQGYAVSDQEVEAGFRALAAPVFDSRAVAGAIGVLGTASSLPVEREGEIAQLVMDAARRLSQALGHEESAR